MATVAITPVQMGLNESGATVTFTAITSTTDGALVDCSKVGDEKLIVLIKNNGAAAQTATLKMGNGIQGVADATTASIAAGGVMALQIESGKFKQVTGTYKGKINIIGSTTDIQVAAIVQL